MLDLARGRVGGCEDGVEDGGEIHGVDGGRQRGRDDGAGAGETRFLLLGKGSDAQPVSPSLEIPKEIMMVPYPLRTPST